MKSRIQLIQELEDARSQMKAVVQRASENQKIYPPWTMKEIVAHLTGWDDAIIASLRAHAAGDLPDVPARRGIDDYNKSTVTERETLPYDHILKEWETTRDILIEIIEKMPEDRVELSFVYPWGQSGNLEVLLEVFIEHEIEHADEINNILDQATQ